MAIGFILSSRCSARCRSRRTRSSFAEPIRALRDRRLLTMAIVAVLYNFGFFTLLAYTPFPLGLGIHQLGLVFFGWGLLLALTRCSAAPLSGARARAACSASRPRRWPRTCWSAGLSAATTSLC